MKLDRFLRLTIGLLILLVFVIAIGAMIFITESALNVWDRLIQGPRVILYGYIAAMFALVIAAIWLIVRLVVKRKISPESKTDQILRKPDIEERLRVAELQNETIGRDQARCISRRIENQVLAEDTLTDERGVVGHCQCYRSETCCAGRDR